MVLAMSDAEHKAADLVALGLGQIKQNGSFRSHKSMEVMINSSSVCAS